MFSKLQINHRTTWHNSDMNDNSKSPCPSPDFELSRVKSSCFHFFMDIYIFSPSWPADVMSNADSLNNFEIYP